MNAREIVYYGQKHVEDVFRDLPDDAWSVVGVTSRWTLRDLLAHLVSFELLLEDSLTVVAGERSAPAYYPVERGFATFNDDEVAARAQASPAELMRDLAETHARVLARIETLGAERLAQAGTVPWYGAGYSLDDMIVYANYGHKREHCAQVKTFRARIGK